MAQHDYYGQIRRNTKPITQKILSKHFSTPNRWTPVQAAAALHYYLYHKIPYKKRGSFPDRRPLRNPVQTWKHGGNCEEKSILLCNLLHNITGVKTEMIAVKIPNSDNDHLLSQVGFTRTSQEITDTLNNYYAYIRKQHGYDTPSGEYAFKRDPEENTVWYVADPEMSNYLGDISSLEKYDIVVKEDGGWDWYHKKRTTKPGNNL